MKSLRLFLHLVKFHFLNAPKFLWLIALGFSVFFGLMRPSGGLGMGDNLLLLVCILILASQMSWGVRGTPTTGTRQNWASGAREFLWTRAVDRDVLFWSKLAVFAAICSLAWFGSSAPQLFRTEPVQVTLRSGAADQAFKAALLETPAFAARVAGHTLPQKLDDGVELEAGEIIALDRGNLVLASLGAWKVTAVSLLILWLAGGLRLSWKWLVGVLLVLFIVGAAAFIAFLVGAAANATYAFLPNELAGLGALDYRNVVLLYARTGLWWWLGLALVGAGIVADTRRRYLRPA